MYSLCDLIAFLQSLARLFGQKPAEFFSSLSLPPFLPCNPADEWLPRLVRLQMITDQLVTQLVPFHREAERRRERGSCCCDRSVRRPARAARLSLSLVARASGKMALQSQSALRLETNG